MQTFQEWLDEAKVMILPLRKIPPQHIEKLPPEAQHGAYLDADKFDFKKFNFKKALLNDKFFNHGYIHAGHIDATGTKHPPEFHVFDQNKKIQSLADLKTPNKFLIKINMITNVNTNKKWKWVNRNRIISQNTDYYQITSVYGKGQHYFCLKLNMETPFLLATYDTGEPRSRPTTYGEIELGKKVGTITLGRGPRDLYETITIK